MMLPALAPTAFRTVAGAAVAWTCGLDGRYGVVGDPRQETFAERHDAATRPRSINRRDFLRYSGMGAAMLGGASALVACSSSSTPSSTSSQPAAAGKPKMGGTLHAGLTGGTGSDTVNAHRGVNNVDFARIIALYDPLIGYDLEAQNQLRAGRVDHAQRESNGMDGAAPSGGDVPQRQVAHRRGCHLLPDQDRQE